MEPVRNIIQLKVNNKQFKYWQNNPMQPHFEQHLDFDADSFEQYLNSDNQMQHSHAPSAIPANHEAFHLYDPSSYSKQKIREGSNNYDLTFKKQKQFQFMTSNNRNMDIHQNLFYGNSVQNPQLNVKVSRTLSNTNNQLAENANGGSQDEACIQIIRRSKIFKELCHNLKNHERSNQILKESYLQYLLSQYQIDEITQIKIQTLNEMISLRNLRRKRNSVNFNIEVMKSTAQGNQVAEIDKHRLEILELLSMQLGKKILIQCLRYNRMMNFFNNVLRQLEYQSRQQRQSRIDNMQDKLLMQQEMFRNQIISHSISKQKQSQQNSQANQQIKKGSPLKANHYVSPPQENHYHQQSRLTIFVQIVSSLFNKVAYPTYKLIQQCQNCKKTVPMLNNRASFDQINPVQRQDAHKKYQVDNGVQYYSNQPPQTESQHNEQHLQDENHPIQQIEDYIKTLKKSIIKNPNQSQDIMRNYFIRWKVFFLNNIILKMEDDPQISRNQHHRQQHQDIQKQQYPFSQFASNNSIQPDLKQQKHKLKYFLCMNRRVEFFKYLGELKASKGIRLIIKQQYIKNLKKKAFIALYLNKEEEIETREAQIHAQYIAENQNQDEKTTAEIFHRTNCVAKAYFGLKNFIKYTKFVRILSKTIVKLSFMNLKYETFKQQQDQIKLEKYIQKKRRQYMFKYFIAFKSTTSFSNELNSKIQNFTNRKNAQTKEICFSALCLYWKKKRALIRRVQYIYLSNQTKRFFNNLRYEVNQKYEKQSLQIETVYYVQNIQKRLFIDKLTQNYVQSLKNKRIQAKQARLQIERAKNCAKKGLSEWRMLTLRRRNYSVVQKKLKKVKQLQEKQKVFKLWYSRMIQKFRQKRQDKLTNNHKLWLNKYYEKLCAIQQQQLY